MLKLRNLLLICLICLPNLLAASTPEQRLSFVASYQGLLTAGTSVDIAGLDVLLATESRDTARLQLTISTQDYGAAEFFLPVRLCYRNRTQQETGATLESQWWSRIGGKASHGRLRFNRTTGKVTRVHAIRKLETASGDQDELWEGQEATAASLDLDRDELPFPDGNHPMDQLSMMLWLRRQSISPGDELDIPVTNGRYLIGYRVVAEAEENIDWHGEPTQSLRLRLEPRVNDDHDTDPTWLWIGQDPQRLPLRLRSERKYGRFDLTLKPRATTDMMDCRIPETASLILPN